MIKKNTQDNNAAPYTLTRSENIIEKLTYMQKLAVMIYVKPADATGNGVMSTIITRVLPNKNLLAIDMSADHELNQALQNSGALHFSATVDGVAVHFKAPKLIPATLGGKPVFAVPIPHSLYWRERRRSHRLSIPPSTPIACSMLLPGLNLDKFPVLDLSMTGFAVLDEGQLIINAINIGHIVTGCQFSRPVGLKDHFHARLCRKEEVGRNGTLRSFKMGFSFEKRTPVFEKGLRELLGILSKNREIERNTNIF
jgi:c-di-GMP-binding flagellar brake protein YcgR